MPKEAAAAAAAEAGETEMKQARGTDHRSGSVSVQTWDFAALVHQSGPSNCHEHLLGHTS